MNLSSPLLLATEAVTDETYAKAVIIMVVITTVVAPLLLRWVFPSEPETSSSGAAEPV